MKIKIITSIAVALFCAACLFASAKIIISNYHSLRSCFLNQPKGMAQHIINSFIN